MQAKNVPHGPQKDQKTTDVKMPVLELPTTDSVKAMVSAGHITTQVEGIQLQNGLTTLNQVTTTIEQ
jgi:hypothetical protein